MFIRPISLFVPQIPKNASRTLVEAARRAHGDDAVMFDEHLTMSVLMSRAVEAQAFTPGDEVRVLAVVREPTARLLSGLNSLYGDTPSVTLRDALRAAESHRGTAVFDLQSRYLDRLSDEERGYTPVLVPMDHLVIALTLIGYLGKPFNTTASTKRWAMKDVVSDPAFQSLISGRYRPDEDLYRRACR